MKPLSAIAVVAAIVAASHLSAVAGAQEPQGRTIVLTEQSRAGSFAYVDNPPTTRFSRRGVPRRASVGDLEVFSVPLLDGSGRRAGRLDVQCVVTVPGPVSRVHLLCMGGVTLADGLISISATVSRESSTVRAAVIGGTGAYVGARGSLTSVTDGTTTTDTIVLVP